MLSIIPKSEAIKQLRLRAGFSLRDLGKSSDLNPSTISNIENGNRSKVSPRTARLICNALNVCFDDLFEINTKMEVESNE